MPDKKFVGSTFEGFSALGKKYDQIKAVQKFSPYFLNLFKKGNIIRNKNGNTIDLPTKLMLRSIGDYSPRGFIPAPKLSPSEQIASYTIPSMKEVRIITETMLRQRMASENLYDNQPLAAGMVIVDLMSEMDESISRRNELSSIQAVIDGEVTSADGKNIISFPKIATHDVTPGNLWTDLDNSNPIADLDNLFTILHKDGGTSSFTVYMGSEAWEYFISNNKVRDNVEILSRGKIQPLFTIDKADAEGVYTWASFITPRGHRVAIKQYNQLYDTVDENGYRNGSEPFFPEKDVLIMADGCPLTLGIGTPEVLEPYGNAPYKYMKYGDNIVTIESKKTHIELIMWACSIPLLPYMDRLGTIRAIA